MSGLHEAYIVAATRTPVGKARGVFRYTRPDDLGAHVIKSVLKACPNFDPALLGDVIMGCAMPEAEQGMNVARIASLLAGIPESVPAMTVNRFCSSGLQTIALAADQIATGNADAIIAGGIESMSYVPLGGNKFVANPRYFESDENLGIAYGMGLTAELVASKWEISKLAQEEFALESHRRALQAQANHEFDAEISPIEITQDLPDLITHNIKQKKIKVIQDEGPRAGSTIEQLAKLPTVFKARGTVTAATSSQMSDGAAALLIVNEKILKQFNLTPLAKFKSFKVAGVAAKYMGIGPVAAIPLALNAANLKLDQIDWIELNEAFAAQTLAVMKDVKLDPAKTNPLGGAIALGHPLGATGAIRAATLVHGLKRHHKKYGMVTMCIGTGMGAAGIFENV